MTKPITGFIQGSYETRGGETVWVVAWSDRKTRPPVDVKAAPGLAVGQQVCLDPAGNLRRYA